MEKYRKIRLIFSPIYRWEYIDYPARSISREPTSHASVGHRAAILPFLPQQLVTTVLTSHAPAAFGLVSVQFGPSRRGRGPAQEGAAARIYSRGTNYSVDREI